MMIRVLAICAVTTGGAIHLFGQSGRPSTQSKQVATVRRVSLPEGVGRPDLFVGSNNQVAFVDFSDLSVIRSDGSMKWHPKWRRVGAGPGELRSVGSMQFGAQGELWIADPSNARVSVRHGLTMEVLREFRVETPLRAVSPAGAGRPFLALPHSVQSMAIVADSLGRLLGEVAFPADLAAANPITRERYLVRVNDTLSVVQFRWYDRLLGVTTSGRVVFDHRGNSSRPEILAMKLDDKGSVGYRMAPDAVEQALAVAVRADTILVLRGSADTTRRGREVQRFNGRTGALIDVVELPVSVRRLAATKRAVYALGELNDDHVLFEVRWR